MSQNNITMTNPPAADNQALPLAAIIQEAERCVACGLCLPYCPTYIKTGSEADSPRGRIQLMRAVAQNILPNNDRFKAHIDLCLNCRSCESACPNSVQYGNLVDITRTTLLPKKSWQYSLAKPFIRHRSLQYLLGNTLWLLQRVKVAPLLRDVITPLKRLPNITRPSHWKNSYVASNRLEKQPIQEVALFLGCASNAFDQNTLKAAVFICNQLGITVHVPPQQSCCGSIARQMGDGDTAEKLTQLNAQCFDKNIPIVSIASGCGAGLKETLSTHKVLDIHTFLKQCDWSKATIAPLKQTIYVQDPCTLRNVFKGQQAVYDLLNRIPQADILPLPNNGQCCGGAGAYMLTQPAMASDLQADKVKAIKDKQVVTLATANIGCSLHIATGLREQNSKVDVLHPVVIIAQQMGFNAHSEKES